LFEGKSQQRLAEAVAAHITEADQLDSLHFSRLIGLEGQCGSGKSNVIKILEDQYLKQEYTFFYFAAWGNQDPLLICMKS
jgi:KAP family P-loop domain.